MKALLILLAIIAYPLAEIWIAVWLAGLIGWGWVIALAAAFFGFGLAMVQRSAYLWRQAIARGQTDPAYLDGRFAADVGDAGIVLIGGILMIIPGFLTGVLGALLVLPFVRRLVSRAFRGRIERTAAARGYRKVTIIDGETVGTVWQPPGTDPDAGMSHPQWSEASDGPAQGTVISGEVVARHDDPPIPRDFGGDDTTDRPPPTG